VSWVKIYPAPLSVERGDTIGEHVFCQPHRADSRWFNDLGHLADVPLKNPKVLGRLSGVFEVAIDEPNRPCSNNPKHGSRNQRGQEQFRIGTFARYRNK